MKSGSSGKRILMIPSIRKGNGTGHIRRTVKLAADFISKKAAVAILADYAAYRKSGCYSIEELLYFIPEKLQSRLPVITEAFPADWDLCVFDTRDLKIQRLSCFTGKTMTVGLDEGGDARGYFDYLIDVMPNLENIEPNISSTGFLQLPKQNNPADPEKKINKVLVSFGGEDKNNLTSKIITMIEDTGIFSLDQITVVIGPLFKNRKVSKCVRVLESPENLGELLYGYDLVITMFGLTCFEALYSGTPVVLFNPSQYHRSLSIRAGIPEIGVNRPAALKLEEYLKNPERLFRAAKYYSSVKKIDLADFILDQKIIKQKCGGCGNTHDKYIFRDSKHSFFRCTKCGLVNQNYFGNDTMTYDSGYFFEEYKKQYGRTYLEDFQKIREDGLRRCRQIKKLASGTELLDAGCGYGPFLAASDDSGFSASGIEISGDAAAWVQKELGFKVFNTSFEGFDSGSDGNKIYDVITMWYVIEHLEDVKETLEKIRGLLKKGGAFCFSTPNFNGISRLRSAGSFFRNNPVDHRTIWSPSSARRLLAKHGFKVKYIICPSVHPERFFREDVYIKLPRLVKIMADTVIKAVVRIFKIGDTFEVYAVKKR